jgi:cytochrome c
MPMSAPTLDSSLWHAVQMHVLAYANERTYIGGTMGMNGPVSGVFPHMIHPITWCRYHRQYNTGPISWVTGLGTNPTLYTDVNFRAHIRGGVMCAAKAIACDCTATLQEAWQKVQLVSDPVVSEPMVMDIAKDGRIWCAMLCCTAMCCAVLRRALLCCRLLQIAPV